MKFKQITIIGVGLIGGSIGLAIKKRHLAKEVIGVFRHGATLKRAVSRRAIDSGTMSMEEGVKNADLIILASPVCSIPAIAVKAIRYAKKGAIITDVGSTKGWVVDKIDNILEDNKSIFFVGSHPMAGSEHTGVEFAKSDLLKSSPCIVTRTKNTNNKALVKVANFWRALGARVSLMTPTSHDRSVSLISHLPHLVAFSLAGTVSRKDLAYAAEGFKDTTRVAASDPMLWADIFSSNRREVLKSVRLFEKYLKKLTKTLARGDYTGMVRLLKRSKSKRDRLIYGAKT